MLRGSSPAGKSNLRDFLDAIEAAAADPRVKGVLARVGNDEFAVAETQQIRDAIIAFRAKGKFAIAFADSFGESGAGTRPYYLATAFDQIWLQPMGSVGLTGLYSDAMPSSRACSIIAGHQCPEFRPSRQASQDGTGQRR